MESGYSDFSETESLDLRAESRDKIAKLFPEVMKDGLFDFDVLKELLGGDFESGAERYGLFWPGKHDAIKTALEPTNLTLRPLEEQSRNWKSTKNLYIEGDNLETLKLLQKAYANKVKMIYLDPPYNTGGDFVYSDRFKTSKGAYLKENDFLDEDGNVLSTSVNTKVNPEYHTQWLNMMYPRLKLAWNLLQDDGVLYVSIDDNEALKKMLDEVFGENMFIAQIPWRKRTAKSDVPFGISQDYEWVFAYAKSDKFKASVEGAERKYFESADFPGRPMAVA